MDETREKVRKLRRYGRKDYTQLVDFPVEIVGRDGVVRQYSFDESVRLYQRRIASAALRYADGEIVSAEQGHCRRRIEQLRRSYLARYGWSAIRVIDVPGLLAGEFAGELAAFLRRVTEKDEVGPDDLELAFIEDGEDHQLYYVRLVDSQSGVPDAPWLLYLYRFVRSGSCPGRDAFFGFLKVLQGVQRGAGAVERLVAFHHTGDCGLILTGQAETARTEPPAVEVRWLSLGEVHEDPLRDGMAALRRGQQERALELFVEAFEAQPFRRPAYVGAVVLADRLGVQSVGEQAALMGTSYFPDDAVLVYHLALMELRRGRAASATQALDRLVELGVEGPAPGVLRALVQVRRGDVLAGHLALGREWRRLRAADESEQQDLRAAVRLVLRGLRWRSAGASASILTMITGLAASSQSLTWLGCVAAGAVALPVLHSTWRRGFLALLAAPGGWGLQLANPADLRPAGQASRRLG